jgi:phosphoglucomutase
MALSPLAGKPASKDMLVDLDSLEREYYECRPELADPNQLVAFGTSGHRGSPPRGSFTEAHILAITQAICDYRQSQGTDGLLWGRDTHALSAPAQRTGLEVLAANGVETVICFGGDESAGASFLRFDGTAWTTDKDGPIMDLLAAEIMARTQKARRMH